MASLKTTDITAEVEECQRRILAEALKPFDAVIEAGRIKLKVGTLSIDCNEMGQGHVLLDGISIPVKSITVSLAVGKLAEVTCSIAPRSIFKP